ncbi:Methane oxygenase PmoA [bacterium A37T11]|nr:Methane oxygenase PmoA [bacterium A37T11]
MVESKLKTGLIWVLACMSVNSFAQHRFKITADAANHRVDISVNSKPFTSYIYPDTIMKPVLYPLRTTKGTLVTRGWPIDPRPGERVDHPHHIGLWFNYGNVNGLDFWNNSTAIAAEKKGGYGTIRHASVDKIFTGNDKAELGVTMFWLTPSSDTLLRQNSTYIFREEGSERSIELVTTLTALKQDVSFKDNKEGLLGLRLARELEHPSDKPEKFTDANGLATNVAKLNNDGVTGSYRSSEGKEGDAVWGTRAKWVNLRGKIKEEQISLVILDHPKNIGYPTYWHARGYGLYAANPLGQHEMSGGKETLDFKLPAGHSVTFKYKVLIHSGEHLTDEQVNTAFTAFSKD